MWTLNSNDFCIAISGLSGCGNTTVTTQLSEILHLKLINYTFRNLAKEKNMQLHELAALAEHDDTWDLIVDDTQVKLALQEPSVVGSRLAIWKIPHPNCKIYLEANLDTRAKRIAQRESWELQVAKESTHKRDIADALRYQRLYNIDINNYKQQTDLVINNEDKAAEEVVAIILQYLVETKQIYNANEK